jgi:hypothetical protein
MAKPKVDELDGCAIDMTDPDVILPDKDIESFLVQEKAQTEEEWEKEDAERHRTSQ